MYGHVARTTHAGIYSNCNRTFTWFDNWLSYTIRNIHGLTSIFFMFLPFTVNSGKTYRSFSPASDDFLWFFCTIWLVILKFYERDIQIVIRNDLYMSNRIKRKFSHSKSSETSQQSVQEPEDNHNKKLSHRKWIVLTASKSVETRYHSRMCFWPTRFKANALIHSSADTN